MELLLQFLAAMVVMLAAAILGWLYLRFLRSESPKRMLPWQAWVAVIAVLAIIAALSLPISSNFSARQLPKIEILQPRNQDYVPYQTQISGRYEGNLARRNLWVIVHPQGADRYYPQRPAEMREDGSWFVMAHFGQNTLEEGGKAFDIFVYLADSQADQVLREYVKKADETGIWPGVLSLPSGSIQVGDPVRVIRQAPSITVQVLQPRNQDSVPYQMEVRGRYEGDVTVRAIWVIVHPLGSNLYYPQQPAEIQKDSSWSVTTRFGSEDPKETGKKFDILVCLASAQAEQVLRQYVDEAIKAGDWPGLPSLPSGLTVVEPVIVIRR
jgi:uncharacterized lipoprotein YmbA